jgi:hypothetical protein
MRKRFNIGNDHKGLIQERRSRNPLRKAKWAKWGPRSTTKQSFKEYTLLLDRLGFKIYADSYIDPEEYFYIEKISLLNIKTLHRHYKGLAGVGKNIPVVITDFKKNPKYKTFRDEGSAAFYLRNTIYIDLSHISDSSYWIHEYAHYVSFKIPDRYVKYIEEEYRKMLEEYFKIYLAKRTKRKNLEGDRFDNKRHREMMTKSLGLPSEYSVTNPDEFFAEILTHWHVMPIDKKSFRLKKIIRNILSRF